MQSAQVAAKALDGQTPVEIIDSESASMGIGNLVLYAAAAGEQRRTRRRDRAARSRTGAPRQKVFATLDTLEYLRKGGRIGGAQALLGTMLSIKPIIEVANGVVEEAGQGPTRVEGARARCSKNSRRQGRNDLGAARAWRPTSTSSSRAWSRSSATPRSWSARSARSSACTPGRA